MIILHWIDTNLQYILAVLFVFNLISDGIYRRMLKKKWRAEFDSRVYELLVRLEAKGLKIPYKEKEDLTKESPQETSQ